MAKDVVCECGRVLSIDRGRDEVICPDCGKVNYRPEPSRKSRATSSQRTCPKCYRLAKPGEDVCLVCGTALTTGLPATPERTTAEPPRGITKVAYGLIVNPLRTMSTLASGRYSDRFLVKMVIFFLVTLFLTFIPQGIDFSPTGPGVAPETQHVVRILGPVWIFIVNMVVAVVVLHLSAYVYGGGQDFISAFCLIGFVFGIRNVVLILAVPLGAIPAVGTFLSAALLFVATLWYGFMLVLINWKVFQNYLGFAVSIAVLVLMLNSLLEFLALDMIPKLAEAMAVHVTHLSALGG